ncbi:hypothetical protein IX53_00690 [Kosmotoga pacifica]|uniref:Uncharacterized protein n=1 Tax=Kosmotoga pacifica TaxID=1330330 RepID=A0A0G2ZDP8_9BACT|nr:hypothetical protein IX53_00690 [Kosmotoga pacifica]
MEAQNPEAGAEANETQEAIHDDQNPMEVLKATAEQLGVKDIHIFSEKELQSIIDQRVTQAIKTREERLRKQQEIEKMKEKGQYEQLLREERRAALEDLRAAHLQAKGLPADFAELVNLDDLLDHSLTEAKDKLLSKIDTIATKLNEIIEQKVTEKLKSMEQGTFTSPESQTPTLPKDPHEAIKQIFQQARR